MNKKTILLSILMLGALACTKTKPATSKTEQRTVNGYWYVSAKDPAKLEGVYQSCVADPPRIVKQTSERTILMVRLNKMEVERLKVQGLDVQPAEIRINRNLHASFRQQALQCPDPAEFPEPQNNTFCGYDVSIARCDQTISAELQDMANNASYAQVVDLGMTHQGHELLGIRIGKLTQSSDLPSPQVVIVAGQHGNELIAPEMAMRVARYYYNGYATNLDGIQDLLQDRTLTIVPVANPDGYDHWFLTGNPLRYNGNSCMGQPSSGVDLNRNHAFDWVLGINSTPYTCSGLGAGGLTLDSEPETQGVNALIGHDSSLSGSYITGVMANLHSSGGIIGYPPGVDANRTICALNHRSNVGPLVESKANCSTPDQDILNEVFGTQRPSAAFLKREFLNNRVPYDNGSKGRVFNYGASGTTENTVLYGPMAGTTQRTLSALIEMTKDRCFSAEDAIGYAPDRLDMMESDMVLLTRNMLDKVPKLVTGTHLSDKLGHKFALPHIYRIKADVEHPRLRFGVKNELTSTNLSVPANYSFTHTQDITIPGVQYRTWYAEPSDPDDAFVYPGEVQLCEIEGACATVKIDDGPVDLCSQSGWTVSGWDFVGRQTTGPSNQCYWRLTDSLGILTRRKVDLTQMVRARLVFSYNLKWEYAYEAERMKVYVSNNGFQNCSVNEGTGCRLIDVYYEMNNDGRAGEPNTLRTEMFDVSDFDGENEVQVRFEVINGSEDAAYLYDVHFIGWKKK